MKKYLAYAVAAVLMAASVAMLWMSHESGTFTSSASTEPVAPLLTDSAAHIAGGTSATTQFVTGLEGLPASLRGTEAPSVTVDDQGRLIINRDLRNVFDYFLTTIGEEPVDTIIARIRAYLRNILKGKPAADQADQILTSYINYKRALLSLPPSPAQENRKTMDLDAYQRQLDQTAQLRRQYLSAEVIQAFFGEEDAYDQYTLARLRLMQDAGLSQAARDQQIASLEQQLPASIQEHLKQARQLKGLQDIQESCSKRNCSASELHDERVAMVGAEATTRLEKLDQDTASWDARISSWLNQRASILGNTALSESDRQQQVATARNALFSSAELVQVKNLEQIHDEGGPTTTAALLKQN